MDEVDLESSARVLHIYPQENYETRREIYFWDNLELNRRRRFKIKLCKLKRVLKKRKLFTRKFPRTSKEHTEFDKYPYETTCPNCLRYIRTIVYHYNTGATHAFAATLIPICMCMIPYVTSRYKNTAHFCPICKIYLGTKFGSGRDVFQHCIKVTKCK